MGPEIFLCYVLTGALLVMGATVCWLAVKSQNTSKELAKTIRTLSLMETAAVASKEIHPMAGPTILNKLAAVEEAENGPPMPDALKKNTRTVNGSKIQVGFK